MRAFVTGIGGFVGPHLVRHLLAQGDEVAGSYLGRPLGQAGVREWELDLADTAGLARAIGESDADVVFHFAGRTHVGASWQQMPEYFEANVAGTDNLLRAAAGRRVVFASSAEVYGLVPTDEQPIAEERPPAPRTPYALTKAAAELIARRAGALVVRTFNLIGPGQDPSFALPAFASQLVAVAAGTREPNLRVGNLAARRDFVHVDDAAIAYRLLAERGEAGAVYNLASGEATAISAVLACLLRVAAVEVAIVEDPERMRPADLPLLQGDASRLRAMGWRPQRTVEEAVRELWCAVSAAPAPAPSGAQP
jgi:GDP-4-dehydro-6-deoxy-D-mannose reductase